MRVCIYICIYMYVCIYVCVCWLSLTVCASAAASGRGGVHEAGHDPGDGAQLQGVPAQQAADAEGGTHDGEAGEAAEAGAGEEAPAEAPGERRLAQRNPGSLEEQRTSHRALAWGLELVNDDD